jgi:O-antigen/teichoic acid export membrane protein
MFKRILLNIHKVLKEKSKISVSFLGYNISLSPFFTLIVRGSGAILGFIANILVGRLLGAGGAGFYFLFISWKNFFGNMIGLGFPPYLMRTVSKYAGLKRTKDIYRIVITSIIYISMLGLILFSIGYLFRDYLASIILSDNNLGYLLIFSLIGGTFFILIRVLVESIKSLRKANTALFIEYNIIPFFLVIILGYLLIFNVTSGVEWILFIYLSLLVLTFGIALITFVIFSKNKLRFQFKFKKIEEKRSLFVFWLLNLVNVFGASLPFIFLPHLVDAADIGIFGASQRLVAIASTILVALGSIFGPRFARNYSAGDLGLLKKNLIYSQFYSGISYLPIFLIFFFIPGFTLGLFGEEFVIGSNILIVMAFGQLINASTGSVGFFLNMINLERISLIINFISIIAMAILLYVLGRSYGLLGIAMAYAGVLSIKNLSLLAYSFYAINSKINIQTK